MLCDEVLLEGHVPERNGTKWARYSTTIHQPALQVTVFYH